MSDSKVLTADPMRLDAAFSPAIALKEGQQLMSLMEDHLIGKANPHEHCVCCSSLECCSAEGQRGGLSLWMSIYQLVRRLTSVKEKNFAGILLRQSYGGNINLCNAIVMEVMKWNATSRE